MSKTLFNTNTFQSKTLQNSNKIDIGESNVTNFTATNATITNLTNAELQAATTGVSTNATAITTKQPIISADNRLSATLIGDNGNVSNAEFGYLSTVTSNIQTQIDSKEPVIDASNRLSATLIGDNGNVSNAEFGHLSTVTSNIQTQIDSKEPVIDSSNRLSATLIGDNGNVSNTEYGYLYRVSSGIQGQIDSKEPVIDSSNRLSATLIGDNGDVTNTEFGYLSTVTSNIQIQIDSKQGVVGNGTIDLAPTDGSDRIVTSNGVFDALATKQATLSTGDGIDITGTTISFDGTISQNITAGSGNSITAGTLNYIDGGVSTSVQSKIDTNVTNITNLQTATTDFSFSAGTTTIANDVVIDNNSTEQLLVKTEQNGSDAVVKIRGKRGGSTTQYQAQLRFENWDNQINNYNTIGRISGKVSDSTNNYGGIEFNSYADGSTPYTAMVMDKDGVFTFSKDIVAPNITSAKYYQAKIEETSYDDSGESVVEVAEIGANFKIKLTQEIQVGSIVAASDSLLQITTSGTYKFEVQMNFRNKTRGNRTVPFVYLAETAAEELDPTSITGSQNNRCAFTYIRRETFGTANSLSFSYIKVIDLSSADYFTCLKSLMQKGDVATWGSTDTLTTTTDSWGGTLIITKIA